jgi:Retroviral aspartyl protease
MPDLTVAYRDFGLGEPRPFLVLVVTGPTGAKGSIAGLIDTGADGTVLPAGYAPLMGYTPADITAQQGAGVGGVVTMQHATRLSHAFIPEIPSFVFETIRASFRAAKSHSGGARTCSIISMCTSWSARNSSC